MSRKDADQEYEERRDQQGEELEDLRRENHLLRNEVRHLNSLIKVANNVTRELAVSLAYLREALDEK